MDRDEVREGVLQAMEETFADARFAPMVVDLISRSMFLFQQQRGTARYVDLTAGRAMAAGSTFQFCGFAAHDGAAYRIERIGWRQTAGAGVPRFSARINGGGIGGYASIQAIDICPTSLDYPNLIPVDIWLPPGGRFDFEVIETGGGVGVTVECRVIMVRVPLTVGPVSG